MFFKKRLPDLTNEAYERWLRAQRPPFEWFLRLSEVEQEQLAMLGDAHAQDFAVASGYAMQDPEAADAGISAMQGDSDAEETLARKLAQGFASKLMQMQPAPQTRPDRPQPSMAGFGDRRTEDQQHATGARLWGVEARQA